MSIEKMKLVNIIGAVDSFDDIVKRHIVGEEIHIDNIFDMIKDRSGLYPYGSENIYGELYKNIKDIMSEFKIDCGGIACGKNDMPPEEITTYVNALNTMLCTANRRRNELTERRDDNNVILQQLTPLCDADVNLDDLFGLKNIKLRFGYLPRASYAQMDTFLKNYESFFVKFSEDKDKVYGAYFTPAEISDKVDGIYSSLYFNRTIISDKAHGKPSDAIDRIKAENEEINTELLQAEKNLDRIKQREYDKLCCAYTSAKFLYDAYSVRRYAAHTDTSFYLAGWVTEETAKRMEKSFEKEENIVFVVDDSDVVDIMPPTKLKNNKLFKPFENYVKMYGTPGYNELDPTAVFALSYSLMFGIMYGDVGHGLSLVLMGILLKLKKNFLGPILTVCGVVSTFFGFMFGSIFGNESLIKPILFRPFDSENIMTTLLSTVVLGVILITIAMIMNVINGIKQKDKGKILFDPNGIAGLVFYWAVIIAVLSVVMGSSTVKTWYILLFVVVPLVLMFLKEPLSKLIEGKKERSGESVGQFVLEKFFEMFELLLSYITNTISFIRVGAFALIHAGMLSVVLTLAEMSSGASGLIINVIGNIVVIGLEALLVSIQVLRLQFYEMFSRYYSGTGREFQSKF